ncbi:hypothetical protein GO001_06225 [Streptomyces sp. NRRL B-1677]|uniref:hypothetical protein n=1 Tax=Streptomyces TaxID=1883 RepID=UPI00131A2E54|nr:MULTISPECIES: hypothetical protein [Streptomyces]MBF6044821.1 hypothetical protein [Streptomyces sp. NRRL B-1677]
MAKGDKARSKAEQQAGKAAQTGKKSQQDANDKARHELIRKEQEEWDRRDTFDENFEI